MLENSPGYATWMAIIAEEEQASTSPNWISKMAMKKYLEAVEEGGQIIDQKRLELQAKSATQRKGKSNFTFIDQTT